MERRGIIGKRSVIEQQAKMIIKTVRWRDKEVYLDGCGIVCVEQDKCGGEVALVINWLICM